MMIEHKVELTEEQKLALEQEVASKIDAAVKAAIPSAGAVPEGAIADTQKYLHEIDNFGKLFVELALQALEDSAGEGGRIEISTMNAVALGLMNASHTLVGSIAAQHGMDFEAMQSACQANFKAAIGLQSAAGYSVLLAQQTALVKSVEGQEGANAMAEESAAAAHASTDIPTE